MQAKLNDFNSACLTNLGECLAGELGNSSEKIKDKDFDPLKLPVSNRDKFKIRQCLEAQELIESCSDCRRKCGEAIKKGKSVPILPYRLFHKIRSWNLGWAMKDSRSGFCGTGCILY